MNANLKTKRELLVGLRYNLMEGSFSTGMLVVTAIGGSIVTVFAKEVLNMTPRQVFFLSSLPFLVGIFQPITSVLSLRWVPRKHATICGASLAALLWAVAAWIPWLVVDSRLWGSSFLMLVAVMVLLGSISGVAWTGWMSDSVPEEMRGRFFAKKNVICGIVNFSVLLAAGRYLDFFGNAPLAFAIMFSAGIIFRLLGMYCLSRVPDSGAVEQVRIRSMFRDYTSVLRDSNFMKYVLWFVAFTFFITLPGPAYTYYMRDYLHMSMGTINGLGVIGTLGAILSATAWGKLSDRFGHKPILIVAGLAWLTNSLVGWTLSSQHNWHWILFPMFLAGGWMNMGFGLSSFNIQLKLLPADKKTVYISTVVLLSNLAAFIAPNVGGWLLERWVVSVRWMVMGHEITGYHLLIMTSLVPTLLSFALLLRLREPAERSVNEVIGAMRVMREFNPFLGFWFFIQRVFTPSGLKYVASGLKGVAHRGGRVISETRKAVREVGEDFEEDAAKWVKPPPKENHK